jgi:hypothetical protein
LFADTFTPIRDGIHRGGDMRRALVVVFALGCGGGSSGDGVSLTDFPNALLAALCQHEANCGEFPDVPTCERSNLLRLNSNPSAAAAVAADKILYNAGKARECVDTIANATCDSTDADLRFLFPAACFQTATGTVHAGAACAINDECISLMCTVPSCPDACCQGTCSGDAPPPVDQPIGSMCSQPFLSSECAANAFCDSTTHMCTALKAAGSTCNSSNECDIELGCAGSPATCKALPTLGQPCPDGMCRDEGQVCLTTCVKVGLAGDPCASDASCALRYRCDTTTNKCVEGPGQGSACVQSGDCWGANFCDIPTGQNTGTCAPFKADGQPCTDNTECAGDNCSSAGMCETPGVCI